MKISDLGLKKPDATDVVNINDFNENMDIIESEFIKRPAHTGDAGDTIINFTQASALSNLISGETLKISFGKIAKS